jgi:hypothetical protein
MLKIEAPPVFNQTTGQSNCQVPGSHRRFLAARSGTQVEDLLAQG